MLKDNGKTWKNPRIQTQALLVKNNKFYISIFYSLSIAVTREKEGDYPKYAFWNITLILTLLKCFCPALQENLDIYETEVWERLSSQNFIFQITQHVPDYL